MTGTSRYSGLRATLTCLLTGLLTGLVSGCSVVPSGGGGPPSALGDARWRVEAAITDGPPVLRLWDSQGHDSQTSVENRVFLPSDLARPQGDWQLLQLHVHASRLVVVLQYRPAPQTENFQQKRFEFNLLTPQQPLVFYRASTTRGTLVDWQTVDFVARTALFCRNAPANQPDACTPIPATLRAEPTPTLRTIGSAEDFTAPIDMPVRY